MDTQERLLIGALRRGGDSAGLIGGVVGEQVQNLPSTIYWNSLRRFGILRHDGTPAWIAGVRQVSRPLDDATEFVERSDAVWDPSMPGPPENFFALTSCDFALTRDEATWLSERISQAVPDTLLEFLVGKGNRRTDIAQFAWDDDEVNAAFQSANLVWPEDRSWCVATEIDLVSTYVGGSAGLISAIVASAGLEAWEAKPDDDITDGADRINPPGLAEGG